MDSFRNFLESEDEFTIHATRPPENPGTAAFFDALRKIGTPNPLNDKEIVFDNESAVEFGMTWNREVWFKSLRAFQPGQGAGTRAMQKVIDLADQFHVPIFMDPAPFGSKAMNKRQLITSYKKFGFVSTQGGMIRQPK